MKAILSVPARVLPLVVLVPAALVAVFSVLASPPAPAQPYTPGPRQLAVLAATKDNDYPGAVFRDARTLDVYLTPGTHRFRVRLACGLARRAGLDQLTVRAFDQGRREVHIETFHCDLGR